MAEEALPNERKLHIVMFPWLAFGHLTPFLDLSKAIELERATKSPSYPPQETLTAFRKSPQTWVPPSLSSKSHYRKSKGSLKVQIQPSIYMRLEDVDYLKIAYDLMS